MIFIYKFLSVFSVIMVVSGCSSIERAKRFPLKKKYRHDMVTVQTAIDLARTSYLRGCTDKAKKVNEDNFFNSCLLHANEHVKNNVIFILDQERTKVISE